MFFLMVGVLGLLLKYLEINPVASLSWWIILSPFGLAVAWWAWADASGYTKRKAVASMEVRAKKRLQKQRDALGIRSKRK